MEEFKKNHIFHFGLERYYNVIMVVGSVTVAELLMGSVILPRTDSPKAISRLTEFEWFHKMEMENETVTPEIDDLLLRAQKTHQFIEEIVKGLNIPLRVGIMEILFKGTVIKKKNYDLDEIEDMIQGINARMEQGECSISGGNETCNWLRDNILIHFER